MPIKWIFTIVASYSLYEAVAFASAGPIVLFASGGLVYLTTKDGKR
jgi:hypothetical protein